MNNYSTVLKIFFIFCIGLAFVFSFGSGYLFHSFIQTPQVPSNLTPTPKITFPTQTVNYTPGKHFLEDGFYLATTDASNYNIVASVSRREEGNLFTQNTRITKLDEKLPTRVTQRSSQQSANISPDDHIVSWQTSIDESRVLKEKNTIALIVDKSPVQIVTTELENEMTIRSMPGYTKIFSSGQATITINGNSHPANILYYRLYSLNSGELYFYSRPLGITTDLLVFWDTSSKLFLVDSTDVTHPDPLYQSHAIGFVSDPKKIVSRTFSTKVERNLETPPTRYTISLNQPINSVVNFNTNLTIDKSPTTPDDWHLSTITGTVTTNGSTTSGSGFIEYIKD